MHSTCSLYQSLWLFLCICDNCFFVFVILYSAVSVLIFSQGVALKSLIIVIIRVNQHAAIETTTEQQSSSGADMLIEESCKAGKGKCSVMLKCCFTATETVGVLGTGAQDGHLDFHTAPELWNVCTHSLFLCQLPASTFACSPVYVGVSGTTISFNTNNNGILIQHLPYSPGCSTVKSNIHVGHIMQISFETRICTSHTWREVSGIKEHVMITDERTSLAQNFCIWMTWNVVLNVLGLCFMCCMLAS